MPGLVAHHDVDPHEFLAEVHDVPLDLLTPDPELRTALERLPGQRLVFTNGSAWHAERVLERLGIADQFNDVFHTEAAGLIAKPDPRAFDALLKTHDIAPRTTAFFRGPGGEPRPRRRPRHDHGAGRRARCSLDGRVRAS